jgi:hypothetical protein
MRMRDRVVVTDPGCWEWQGETNQVGHGRVFWDGRRRSVYRVTYELSGGVIPDGYELDHLCRNPRCCNPEHVEPVTHAENMRRGVQALRDGATCHAGRHLVTSTSVYVNPSDGRRRCRPCRNERRQAARAA